MYGDDYTGTAILLAYHEHTYISTISTSVLGQLVVRMSRKPAYCIHYAKSIIESVDSISRDGLDMPYRSVPGKRPWALKHTL